jgi:thymidine kinase
MVIYAPNSVFLNPTQPKPSKSGDLVVVYGSMKSGKTGIVIKTAKLYRDDGHAVFVVKPTCDTRSPKNCIRDRDGNELQAYEIDPNRPLDLVDEVLPKLPYKPTWIFIDEAQFFSKEIYDAVLRLLLGGINVFVAGLTNDFVGRPFGHLCLLFPLLGNNGSVVHLQAQCEYPKCTLKADFHQRTIGGVLSVPEDPVVVIDNDDTQIVYSPRCRDHFSFFCNPFTK